MYNNVNIKNGCYGYDVYDVGGKFKRFDRKGKAVTLDEICVNIENKKSIWRVSFEYLGKVEHYEFPRGNISDKKFVTELQNVGADITTQTFNCFVDSMRWQESLVTSKRNIFDHVGWIKLPINGKTEYCYRCMKLLGGLPAEYVGNLVITPKGSLENWTEMVKTEVLGRPPLETILLAALSAPIVGIYGMNSTTDNPIYHINYRSGRGKSTACKLAASTAGEPFEGMRLTYDNHGVLKEQSSIFGSWGATPKATISAHAGNRGIPVILNELGKFTGTDMTTVVFNLSEGSDIKRLNTQLETIVTEGFNTVFISCGEMSLIDRCKSKLEGIKCRVLEMSVPMTDDADHARRLEAIYTKNNGFAVPMIADYIIKNGGYDMIQEMHDSVLKELTSTAPSGISDRFIEKFPTFLVMAAKIAEKALKITFNVDTVVDFCYECANAYKEDEGDVCKSFEEIIETFNINADKFFDDKRPGHTPKEVWGKIIHSQKVVDKRRLIKEFCVYPNQLKKILKDDLNYPNPITELKLWRDKGVLACDDKHLTKKITFKLGDTDKTRMYVLQIWEDVQPKTQNASQIATLLDGRDDGDTESITEEVTSNEPTVA